MSRRFSFCSGSALTQELESKDATRGIDVLLELALSRSRNAVAPKGFCWFVREQYSNLPGAWKQGEY